MGRNLLRTILVVGAVLSVATSLLDVGEVVATGTLTGSRSHLARLAVDSAIVSVLTAWYLGWRV